MKLQHVEQLRDVDVIFMKCPDLLHLEDWVKYTYRLGVYIGIILNIMQNFLMQCKFVSSLLVFTHF